MCQLISNDSFSQHHAIGLAGKVDYAAMEMILFLLSIRHSVDTEACREGIPYYFPFHNRLETDLF